MSARGLRAVFLFFCAVGGTAACSLSVSFDGTRYKCDPPDGECPGGSSCQADGTCAPDDPGAADADVSDGDVADAPVGSPAADANVTPTPITVTFGDRPSSMRRTVTSDTGIDSDNPNGNFGGAPRFFCDLDNAKVRVGLLRFDLASVPFGATVVSASLELWTGNDPLANGTVQFFRLTEEWTEGTGNSQAGAANFSQRKQGTAWAGLGATSPSSDTSTIVAEGAPRNGATPYTFALPASLVQAWVNAPATNFGISCFVSPGVLSDTDFEAKESLESDRRPELTVTYVP
jgi:hypothetical protein